MPPQQSSEDLSKQTPASCPSPTPETPKSSPDLAPMSAKMKTHRPTNSDDATSYDADSESDKTALSLDSLTKRLSLTSNGEEKEKDLKPKCHKRRETVLFQPAESMETSVPGESGDGTSDARRNGSDDEEAQDAPRSMESSKSSALDRQSIDTQLMPPPPKPTKKMHIDGVEKMELDEDIVREEREVEKKVFEVWKKIINDSPSKKREVPPSVDDMSVKRPKYRSQGMAHESMDDR